MIALKFKLYFIYMFIYLFIEYNWYIMEIGVTIKIDGHHR